MKKIIIVWVMTCVAILAGIRTHGYHEEHGEDCGCGLSRWETIEQNVFPSSDLRGTETGPARYRGVNTLDENENTAWCVGPGTSPYAHILYGLAGLGLFQRVYGIEILPGYTKSDNFFKMNNRPKKILIEVTCAEHSLWGAKEIVAYSKEIVLKDERSYQKFMFNGKSTSEIIEEYCVKNGFIDYIGHQLQLTILEVYKGSKYDDTCISGVRFLDKNDKPIKLLPDMK